MSILSTFFARFFGTNTNCATFSNYVLLWQKDFGAKNALSYEKLACKMMMKLTPGGGASIGDFYFILWGLGVGDDLFHSSISEHSTIFFVWTLLTIFIILNSIY
jgi:hypothetical protein